MKLIAVVPADDNHLEDFNKFEKSLRKFHSEEELPLLRWSDTGGDPEFWLRAKPVMASKMFKDGYDTVVLFDADQIVLGKIDDIWKGEFDVATVLNDPTYPAGVWDIRPYFNNGLVVLKSPEFATHWLRLCYSPHFGVYQYREQDILNILASDYHNYKVRCLDVEDKIYGEFAKPVWAQAKMEGDKVMVQGKQIMMVHFGGGSADPSKGNFRIRFSEDVVKYIEGLIK